MTSREVAEFLEAQVKPQFTTQIVGETLIIDTPYQRFYVKVQEDKDWRPPRST